MTTRNSFAILHSHIPCSMTKRRIDHSDKVKVEFCTTLLTKTSFIMLTNTCMINPESKVEVAWLSSIIPRRTALLPDNSIEELALDGKSPSKLKINIVHSQKKYVLTSNIVYEKSYVRTCTCTTFIWLS